MPSALAALQNPMQGPGGPGPGDPRRKAIEAALLKKIQAEKLMGTFSPEQYNEAVDYYTKNNTMPTWEGMTAADTSGTPPQNPDQPASAPTPSGPGFMDRLGSAVGHMVSHPLDTFNQMTEAPVRAAASFISPTDEGEFQKAMQSVQNFPVLGGASRSMFPEHAPTETQRNLGGAQVAATVMAPGASKLLGSTLTGAGLGALFAPEDPMVGATLGGAMGKTGDVIAGKLAAREAPSAADALRAKFPPKPQVPNEAAPAPTVPPVSAEATAAADIGNLLKQRTAPPEQVPPAVADMEIPAGVKTAAPAGLNIEEAPTAPKEFGGERVNFAQYDNQKVTQAQQQWESLTPNKRASLLGDKVLKAVMGEKPDARVVSAINQSDITKLPGYMQRALLRSVGAEEPTSAAGVTPRKGKMAVATPTAPAAPVDLPQAVPPTGDAEASSVVTKRQGKLKRADVLANAPRTPDGMIDWDRLSTAQREAAAQSFGNDYRQKVQTMSLAQMQAVLKPGQMDVIIKQLSRPPKAKVSAETAAPAAAAPGTEAPVGAPVSAPDLAPGGVSPRGKMTVVEQDESPVVAGRVSAPADPVIAAAEKPSGMSPAGYNKLTPEARAGILRKIADQRQLPIDHVLLAQKSFEELPPVFRREIPTLQAPIAGEPVGGAAGEAAGFPGTPKRRPKGKRK